MLTEFDILFDYYCDELIAVMDKLELSSCKIITKQQLINEFKNRGCYGAFFSLFSVPMRLWESAQNDEIKRFLDQSQDGYTFRKEIYANSNVQALLQNLLNYFDKKGFLD